MIKLNVKEYCQECPMFEADVEVNELSTIINNSTTTFIRCKRRFECNVIYKYLCDQFKSDKE